MRLKVDKVIRILELYITTVTVDSLLQEITNYSTPLSNLPKWIKILVSNFMHLHCDRWCGAELSAEF